MRWPRNCWIQKVEKGIPLKKKEIVEMKPRARGMLEKEQVTCKFLLVFRAGVPTSTLPRTARLLGVIIHYWGCDKKISHCIEKLFVCHRGETQTLSFVTEQLPYWYTLTSLTLPLAVMHTRVLSRCVQTLNKDEWMVKWRKSQDWCKYKNKNLSMIVGN